MTISTSTVGDLDATLREARFDRPTVEKLVTSLGDIKGTLEKVLPQLKQGGKTRRHRKRGSSRHRALAKARETVKKLSQPRPRLEPLKPSPSTGK